MHGCGIGYSYKKATLKRKTVREEKNERKSKEEFQIGPKISTNLKRSVAHTETAQEKKSSFCSARYLKDKCRVCMCMLLIKVKKKQKKNVNIKKTIAMLFVACINVSFY